MELVLNNTFTDLSGSRPSNSESEVWNVMRGDANDDATATTIRIGGSLR